MNGGSLANLSLALEANTCLKLENVDMENVQITVPGGNLAANCQDGSKSMITKNTNLCGQELEKLEKYFKGASGVLLEE